MNTEADVHCSHLKRVHPTSSGLVRSINEFVTLVRGGFLTVRAFEAEATDWKLRLFIKPCKGLAVRPLLVGDDFAMRELLRAFGTTESPPGHVVLVS